MKKFIHKNSPFQTQIWLCQELFYMYSFISLMYNLYCFAFIRVTTLSVTIILQCLKYVEKNVYTRFEISDDHLKKKIQKGVI